MTQYQRIFRFGKRHILVRATVYNTRRSMMRRLRKEVLSINIKVDLDGICLKSSNCDCGVVILRECLKDGTAVHEAVHVMQFSGCKDHELQASLVEEVATWIMGL